MRAALTGTKIASRNMPVKCMVSDIEVLLDTPCFELQCSNQLLLQANPRRQAKVAKQIEREVGNLLLTDKVLYLALSCAYLLCPHLSTLQGL